ncbi:SUMO-activating enzyme subunit 1A-like [Prunus yedoensis var. nudiflora]|uniref:SUMO-activating enzyme subunit 1A-like n=1 Tax=Prunus yedoensis var. nudiflora TaxID=2094558 RepID=A0A314Y958_PRUYE|nr:SUMO-activating enzyme subunit 1A-like [Prunus yedoensis var. nudiflora]
MDDEELTEQKTALSNRQIRVWFIGAQRRLSTAHILVCGIIGTTTEAHAEGLCVAHMPPQSSIDEAKATKPSLCLLAKQ